MPQSISCAILFFLTTLTPQSLHLSPITHLSFINLINNPSNRFYYIVLRRGDEIIDSKSIFKK